MFISSIKISDHHQFKDFELDLTYPKGHQKAGQPLDKVCIIGQSGTGKTTLLEELLEVPDSFLEYRGTKKVNGVTIERAKNHAFYSKTIPSNKILLGINNKEQSIRHDFLEEYKINIIKKKLTSVTVEMKSRLAWMQY